MRSGKIESGQRPGLILSPLGLERTHLLTRSGSDYENLREVVRSVRRYCHAYSGFLPTDVQEIFTVPGRLHPVLDGHFAGVFESFYEGNILPDRGPIRKSGSVRPVVYK